MIPLSKQEKLNRKAGIGKKSKYWNWVTAQNKKLSQTNMAYIRSLSGNQWLPRYGYRTREEEVATCRKIQWAYWKLRQLKGYEAEWIPVRVIPANEWVDFYFKFKKERIYLPCTDQ